MTKPHPPQPSPTGKDGTDAPGGHPPAFNVPPATLGLAVLLIAVFAALRLAPEAVLMAAVFDYGFVPLRFLWALDGEAPLMAGILPLVTYMFIHVDTLHLAVNVGFLIAFGSPVERRYGWTAFAAVFLASGIVGGLFELIPLTGSAAQAAPSIGASGGIFGLMGVALAAGLGDPRFRLRTGRIIVALFVVNIVIGLMSEAGLTGGYRIGWQAHAGGFIVGIAIGWMLRWRDLRHG
jgi:membrane associated rhomboid family serine protease